MHAAVVVPPLRDFYFTPHRFANLGVEVVRALLHAHGFKVTTFVFSLSKKKSTRISLPPALGYLDSFIIPDESGSASFFKSYQHFGPDFAVCALQIKAAGPHIIFISCFAFSYADETLQLTAEIKRLLPRIMIVAGGAGVSAYPQYFLKNKTVDFCLTGEAEITLPSFLKLFTAHSNHFNSQDFLTLPNLYLIDKGRIRSSGRQKFTSSEQLDFYLKKSYETRQAEYYSLCLSRGCSKRCRFCSQHLCHGRQFRTVPLEKVKSAMKEAAPLLNNTRKNIRMNFEDDNLLLAPDYFIEILTIFRTYIHRTSFYAENGLDYTLLTPVLLSSLIELGFAQFNLSLGTAFKISAHRENRVLKTRHYEKLLAIIRRHNLPCITYFICGLKGDTIHTIARSLAYLARLPTKVGISLFYAVPGLTDFRNRSIFDSLSPALCKGSSAHPWNGSLDTLTMITAFRLSRFVNMLKSSLSPVEDSLVRLIFKEKKLYTLIKNKDCVRPHRLDVVDEKLVSEFFKLLACPEYS
jgi:radical SAM superfamily enzyme YgiQ (UPF0313 family)